MPFKDCLLPTSSTSVPSVLSTYFSCVLHVRTLPYASASEFNSKDMPWHGPGVGNQHQNHDVPNTDWMFLTVPKLYGKLINEPNSNVVCPRAINTPCSATNSNKLNEKANAMINPSVKPMLAEYGLLVLSGLPICKIIAPAVIRQSKQAYNTNK